MSNDPAIARCFAHILRRGGKPETTIQLLSPKDVRDAAELAQRRTEVERDEAKAEAAYKRAVML